MLSQKLEYPVERTSINKLSWLILKHYLRICMEWLQKTTKTVVRIAGVCV